MGFAPPLFSYRPPQIPPKISQSWVAPESLQDFPVLGPSLQLVLHSSKLVKMRPTLREVRESVGLGIPLREYKDQFLRHFLMPF